MRGKWLYDREKDNREPNMDSIDNTVARLGLEVAACTRIFNAEGVMDYSGHVSARLPDGSGFLVQSVKASRAGLTPDDLYTLSLEGEILNGPEGTQPCSEFHIHSEIYKARDDVNAVLHAHPDGPILFTIAEGAKLEMVRNHGYRWRNGVPVHPDTAHINSVQLGREMVETLGDCNVVLLRAHGVVLVAESVPTLLIDGIHFEENARAVLELAPLGKPIPMSDAELDIFEQRFDRPHHADKLWTYYVSRGRDDGLIPKDWGNLI